MNVRQLKKHLEYRIPKVTLALLKEPHPEPVLVRSPEDVQALLEPLRLYAEEHFVVLHMDVQSEAIGYQIVSHGTASMSLVHPREVFKGAILNNAHAIIVAHNHPSGNATPSSDDLETTKQLFRAGKLLGISVVDHLIVTRSRILSLREKHPEIWGD